MRAYTAIFEELTIEGWQYSFAEQSIEDAAAHLRWKFPNHEAIRVRDDASKQYYMVTPTSYKKVGCNNRK